MSEAAPASLSATPQLAGSGPPVGAWTVRRAVQADAAAVAAAVRELLFELDGTPSAPPAMEAAASTLIVSPWAGAVLVAEPGEETKAAEATEAGGAGETAGGLVGVLAASWQMAIHVPGSYALIQDLWVHPSWRSRSVGAGLLAALFELAHAKRVERVEVGLPRESFVRFASTESFYLDNGFTPNGPRMRRILS